MAISGTFYNYPVAGKEFGLYCTWSATQNAIGNYSDVTLNVYVNYYTIEVGARNDSTVSINGTSETYTAAAINDYTPGWKRKLIKTKTVRVYHDTNGTKNGLELKATWRFSGTYSDVYVGTITASSTVNLNVIDRSLPTATFTNSNITSSSVYINAFASVICDIWEYSIDNGISWTRFSTASVISSATTISGLLPNTTYGIRVRVRKKSNQLYGTSSVTNITTIGGSMLNAVNELIADAENPVLSLNWTVFNSSYTHTLEIKNGSSSIITIGGLTGSTGTNNKTYMLTAEQRTTLLTAMSSVQSFNATFILSTFNGSDQIGTGASETAKISTTAANSAPVFTGFTYSDNNSVTTGITSNNKILIKGHSRLYVTAAPATAKNGADIVRYTAAIGEKSVNSTFTAINYGETTSSGSVALTVSAVDSRGYQTRVSETITVIDYNNVTFKTWNLRRVNGADVITQIQFDGKLSPITIDSSSKNALTYVLYRYKETTASEWSEYIMISGVESTSSAFSYSNLSFETFEAEKSYDIQLTAADRLSTHIVNIILNKGIPLVAFRSSKIGINNPDPQAALDIVGGLIVDGKSITATAFDIIQIPAPADVQTFPFDEVVNNLGTKAYALSYSGNSSLAYFDNYNLTSNTLTFENSGLSISAARLTATTAMLTPTTKVTGRLSFAVSLTSGSGTGAPGIGSSFGTYTYTSPQGFATYTFSTTIATGGTGGGNVRLTLPRAVSGLATLLFIPIMITGAATSIYSNGAIRFESNQTYGTVGTVSATVATFNPLACDSVTTGTVISGTVTYPCA